MSYIGTEPKDIRSFGRTKFDYTATQGQTAFTGADDDGKVLAFTVGQIEVYVNGILMDDSDFTTTGTGTVTLASAANLNDVINIVSFESNIPDNDYVPASGGTFTGTVAHTGDVTITGNANDANGNLKVTTNAATNYPAMVIETSTGGNSTEVHGLHIKNTAAGHGLRIDDESSDTTPFVVASDGKVGIGTATPAKPLSVVKAGGGDFIAEFQNTTNGTPYGIHVKDAASGANGYPLFQVTNGAGNATYFRVDSGTGNVIMPNIPAFSQAGYGTFTVTATGTQVMSGSNVWGSNVSHSYSSTNSGWNTSTGTFTAPVAGRYMFHLTYFLTAHNSGYWYTYLQHNGSTKTYGYVPQTSTHLCVAQSAVFNMAANDTARAAWTNNYATGQIYGTSFSGHLIG